MRTKQCTINNVFSADSPLLRRFPPTIARQRRLAFCLLLAQAGITITGSIVRVTGSGLGCNTWPNCHEGSLVPVPGAAPWIHQLIEYGNRMLTFVDLAFAVLVLVAVLAAHRRKEIIFYALFQGAGIVVQAVIGGISVLLDLAWYSVALHFLPSMMLVWGAAVMYVRIAEPDDGTPTRTYEKSLRMLSAFSAILLSAVLITGTMVTGAGPHSGDAGDGMKGRLEVDIDWMAHVHAWTMYAYLALSILLVCGLVLMQAPRRARHLGGWLLLSIIVQGLVGVLQYRLGVPSWSIPLHIGLCSCVVALSALLWAVAMTRKDGSHWVTGSGIGDQKFGFSERSTPVFP
nr:heme A synthase [Corynebacterium sp. sy017]